MDTGGREKQRKSGRERIKEDLVLPHRGVPTHEYAHMRTHEDPRAHTHTRARRHTHAHTQTHTHAMAFTVATGNSVYVCG